jgi:hypothetical protein
MQQALAIHGSGVSKHQAQFTTLEKHLNRRLIIYTNIADSQLDHPVDLSLAGIQYNRTSGPFIVPGRVRDRSSIGIFVLYERTVLRHRAKKDSYKKENEKEDSFHDIKDAPPYR